MKVIWTLLRLAMGWTFLWPFLDKVFGLGFTTSADKSWLAGNSPTLGFLKFATQGPFSSFYQNLAGNALVDWLFMAGLLLIGASLILGIGIKVAAYSGSLMLFLMWTAALPPEHNPFLDDHIVYIIILIGLAATRSGQYLGLGQWWSKTALVKKYSFLE